MPRRGEGSIPGLDMLVHVDRISKTAPPYMTDPDRQQSVKWYFERPLGMPDKDEVDPKDMTNCLVDAMQAMGRLRDDFLKFRRYCPVPGGENTWIDLPRVGGSESKQTIAYLISGLDAGWQGRNADRDGVINYEADPALADLSWHLKYIQVAPDCTACGWHHGLL